MWYVTDSHAHPQILFTLSCAKSATRQSEGLCISLKFMLLNDINTVQPKGDIQVDVKH